jgi:hypothetical protein
MFARKATIRVVDRVQSIARTTPVRSNDNNAHRMADAPHARALVCRWQIAPATGKPECHWQNVRVMPTRSRSERQPRQPRFDRAR